MIPRIVVVAVAALLLAACGGGGAISSGSSPASPKVTPQQQADKLVVRKAGFGGLLASGYPFYTAAAMIQNPSTKDLASQITVQVTAYGADGKVDGTGHNSLAAIHAGQTFPVAISLAITQGAAVPARVDVLASAEGWFPDPDPKSTIVGSGITITPNAPSQFIVDAVITAQGQLHARDIHSIAVYEVCFDANGNIDDGGESSVDLLPANGQAGVHIVAYGVTPASCTVAGMT